MAEENVYIKVTVIGESGSGKSSILNRIVNEKFDPDIEPTVAANCYNKNICYKGYSLSFIFWDTSGSQVYRDLTHLYCKNADGFIVVCDCTVVDDIRFVSDWIQNFIDKNSRNETQVFVVINKIDLVEDEHRAKIAEIEQYAWDNGLKSYKVSAKNSEMIHELFEDIKLTMLNNNSSLRRKSINLKVCCEKRVKKINCCLS